jgi:hypothetical protein
MRKIIIAALIALLPTVAAAQQFNNIPSGTVIGRTQSGTGPAQAIPFATLIASMLASSPTIPTINTSTILFAGATSGTATLKAQAVAGTPTLQLPNTSGTLFDGATLPLVGNATTGNVSCPNCSISISTRTAAAGQDLSSYSFVRTNGYASVGDGGGAVYKNVGATPFRDSFVVTPTITGNGTGSCTNGTYRAVAPTGGTGTNLLLTVTVSGNLVTAVALAGTGGNAYTTNDTVSATITGCSTTVTFSVGTVSTPSASFTDSAGNHWQIIPDLGNFVNVRQFGAKVDYAGTDGSATNDYTAIQNAYSYCADIHSPTIDGGGAAGCKVIHPPGSSLVCGSVPLEVPQGVAVEGANMWASTLKMCSAWTSGVTFMNICNPNTHAACFGTILRNMVLYSPFAQSSSSNSYMVYSNNVQQVDILDRVAIYAGQRECLDLNTGYGGAELLGMQNVECTPGTTSINAGITINYGTTIVTMRNVHVETGGPATLSGLQVLGGFVHLTGFHTEGISTGIFVNIPTSVANGFVKVEDITGGANCTSLVVRQAGSAASTLYVSNITQNGCTNSVNNAGTPVTTFIGIWTLY